MTGVQTCALPILENLCLKTIFNHDIPKPNWVDRINYPAIKKVYNDIDEFDKRFNMVLSKRDRKKYGVKGVSDGENFRWVIINHRKFIKLNQQQKYIILTRHTREVVH